MEHRSIFAEAFNEDVKKLRSILSDCSEDIEQPQTFGSTVIDLKATVTGRQATLKTFVNRNHGYHSYD